MATATTPDADAISADPATAHFRAYALRDRHLVLFKLAYLIGMGACASYYPFLVIWFQSLGFSDADSGVIMAVSHVTSMVVAPLLSSLADRSERHRRGVLVFTFAGASAAALVMGRCTSFWACMFGAALVDCSTAAMYPIVDASLLALLQSSRPGGDASSYSESRAFGAAGWGAWAWVSGSIYDERGLGVMFVTMSLALLPGLPVAFFLPLEKRGTHTAAFAAAAPEAEGAALAVVASKSSVVVVGASPEVKGAAAGAGAEAAAPEDGVAEFAKPRAADEGGARFGAYYKIFTFDAVIFFVVVYITAILLCMCDIYRSPYLASLGASNELIGIAVTATAVTEAPCFFLAGPLLKRINNTPLVLLLVLLCYAGRFLYYSMLVDPWWTIPAELLHGVTFAMGWAASTEYVSRLLPPELSSTAQGILSAIQFGLASSTGALVGGAIMTAYGGRALFRAGAVLALVGAAIMALSMWRTMRREQAAEAVAVAVTVSAAKAEVAEGAVEAKETAWAAQGAEMQKGGALEAESDAAGASAAAGTDGTWP